MTRAQHERSGLPVDHLVWEDPRAKHLAELGGRMERVIDNEGFLFTGRPRNHELTRTALLDLCILADGLLEPDQYSNVREQYDRREETLTSTRKSTGARPSTLTRIGKIVAGKGGLENRFDYTFDLQGISENTIFTWDDDPEHYSIEGWKSFVRGIQHAQGMMEMVFKDNETAIAQRWYYRLLGHLSLGGRSRKGLSK